MHIHFTIFPFVHVPSNLYDNYLTALPTELSSLSPSLFGSDITSGNYLDCAYYEDVVLKDVTEAKDASWCTGTTSLLPTHITSPH